MRSEMALRWEDGTWVSKEEPAGRTCSEVEVMVYIITKKKSTPRAGLVLHPDKIKYFQDKREGLVRALQMTKVIDHPDGTYTRPPMDKNSIRKKIKDIDHTLETMAPERSLSSLQKDEMWASLKKMIGEVRDGMPTKYEMHPMQLNPVTGVISKDTETLERAVRKNVAWHEKNDKKLIQIKNIARTLGEPRLGEIERLRPGGTSEASRMVSGVKLQGGA